MDSHGSSLFGRVVPPSTGALLPPGTGTADAYAHFIAAAYPWQWFVTVTSANRVAPEALLKRWRLAMSKLERHWLGPRVPPLQRIVWVVGEERHRSGNPHLHAVCWHPRDLNKIRSDSRIVARDLLNCISGWSKVEKPRSTAGASRYCAKYLSKDGELHFSATFGAHAQIVMPQDTP